MKVLVLGGNGFIGSHLVNRLCQENCSVRVFDRHTEKFRPQLAGVDYRYGDFSDSFAIAEALDGVDVVYHLISATVPATSNLDIVGDISNNLINTVRLLELMVSNGVGRIVFLSSGGTVYGIPSSSVIPEHHELNPICSYGIVKVSIEKYLAMFEHLHGLQSAILRVSNPYGVWQPYNGIQGVISVFLNKILTGQDINVWGDGGVERDFLYIDDLIDAMLMAERSNLSGVFNVGSGIGSSLNEILDCARLVTGKSFVVNYRDKRNFDVPKVVLDITKIRNRLAWAPKVSLERGVGLTWEWLISQSGR